MASTSDYAGCRDGIAWTASRTTSSSSARLREPACKPRGIRLAGTSLYERFEWTSTLARAAFGCAVALIGATFVLTLARGDARLLSCLSAIALVLAVVSAGVRTLRSGLTLPTELESYETYVARLREIRERYDDPSSSATEKWRLLERLDRVSDAELHRFLVMKMRSTFIG